MMDKKKKSKEFKLNRRNFLAGASGAIAATAAISTSARPESDEINSCKSKGCDYDVIVMGGGFAGVTAARDCSKNGQKTLLLEARNRLGGRTFYSEFEGHHIEMGGTWIHWAQASVWAEKERYGLEIKETPGFAPNRIITNVEGSSRDMEEADVVVLMEAFAAFTAEARTVWERPYDPQFSWDKILEADKINAKEKLESLNLTDFQKDLIGSLLAALAHNDPAAMSYSEVLRMSAATTYADYIGFMDIIGRYQFKNGTKSLIDAMLDDGRQEVLLATVVKRVEDLGDNVKVTTEDGKSYLAATVISTLPMNVVHNVEFSPALPINVVKAAKEKHAGSGLKFYAKTKKPIGNVLLYGRSDAPISMAWTYKEADDHTLIVCFNNDPEKLDMYDEEDVQASLSTFIPDIEVESVFGYDWNLDPHSQGTWAVYRPDWMSKYSEDFQKDMGRILMASGDHTDGSRGFIDGAIGAGAKAAQRAKRIIG